MNTILDKPDIERALSLTETARYESLLNESARKEEVWGLWSHDGWATYLDEEGREVTPVWPREEYAVAFMPKVAECEDVEPRKMSLDYWMDNWVTSIMNSHALVAVFPVEGRAAKVVSPVHILMDMRAALADYGY